MTVKIYGHTAEDLLRGTYPRTKYESHYPERGAVALNLCTAEDCVQVAEADMDYCARHAETLTREVC